MLILEKMNRYFCLFLAVLIGFLHLSAQRSYGGQPLEQEELQALTRSLSSNLTLDMPALDIDSLLREDSIYNKPIHGSLKFAHKFYVDLRPENSGQIFHTKDGTKIWRLGIRSQGAYSINVIFDCFKIPKGAKLFLYNSDRTQVLGAFTEQNMQASGEFAISPVAGDEVFIEYHEPADADFSGELQLTEIGHDYRGLLRAGTQFQSLDLPCIPLLSCQEAYEEIGKSVCLLILNGDTYCTGTFVNNTAQDGRPYILTASHCLEDNPELAARTVVFMNYLSPRCMENIRGSEEFSLSGCRAKALSKEIDFALLELDELPPIDYRPYLAGWKIDSSARLDTPFVCIHHPNGEGKRYAFGRDTLQYASWTSSTGHISGDNHWNVKHWDIGHTWSGSSGSALLNKQFQIVGLLTGGDSGGTGCSTYSMGDFFSRLYKAWEHSPDSSKQLKHWLDPLASGTKTLGGMDPWGKNPAHRLSNISTEDSIGLLHFSSGKGFLFGHNQARHAQYAEEFFSEDSLALSGVYMMPAKGIKTKNESAPKYIYILLGREKPEFIIENTDFQTSYLEYPARRLKVIEKKEYANHENYIRFEEPVFVGNHFFVGYNLPYPNAIDTFAMYSSMVKKDGVNTALFGQNGEWIPFTEHPQHPIATAQWIEPLVHVVHQGVTQDSIRYHRPPEIISSSADNQFVIYFPGSRKNDISFTIYDLTGKVCFRTTLHQSIEIFPIPMIPNGLYIATLQSGQQKHTQKIIIRR